jgi:hypothetical protein
MAANWFVRGGGKVYGPIDGAKLKQLAAEGKIDGQTEVAVDANGPWHPASAVKGLFPAAENRTQGVQPAASAIAKPVPVAADAMPWYRSRLATRIAYPALAILVGLLVLSLGAVRRDSRENTAAAMAAKQHPAAYGRGAEAGEQAGQAWGGSELPDTERLQSLAKAAAEKEILKNTALIGSGSDAERDAYALAYIQKFPSAYVKAKPLRLARARKRGEDDGHQMGFLWAKVGKKEPDKTALTYAASEEAEKKIPSNTAMQGSGTDAERREYVKGFVSEFGVGYRKAN